ncbi:hypothetical protein PL263_15165 [Methylomonas sp. EFPC3]|uniref:hypothetical protein n=1 Tax=Methylomonas sp. EFPC3 TaxID=3021710 RepID=UPI0024179797|nr:hypothetical protein [Methylomonas sp. EFPC3]WFP49428.1 hypothetical protein PL263_15165 [Methylomonas sp. EFPC3]
MSEVIRYRYRLPSRIAASLLFAALAPTSGLAYLAVSAPLSQYASLIGLLTVASGICAVLLGWIVARASFKPHYIELREEEALLPKASLTLPIICMPYSAIEQVKRLKVSGHTVAVVVSAFGEARVNSGWFTAPGEFAEFLEQVERRRLQHAKTKLPAFESLLAAIRERSQEDPLAGAKIAAQEVFHRLTAAMQNDKGVHAESLLCALGALAGYACQASVRQRNLAEGLAAEAGFVVIEGTDGNRYFYGDALNSPLAESQYSVWGLAAAAAQKSGCQALLDVGELFRHSANTLGSAEFGVLRLPLRQSPADKPLNYLKALWPNLLPTVQLLCPAAAHWPILFGLAIQDAIHGGKTVIDPCIALKIVMESAITMSKVDLGG